MMPHRFVLVFEALLCYYCLLLSTSVNAQSNEVYLSDLEPTSATSGYGPLEKDQSNGESAAGDGHPVTLRGTTYAKGLGVHADSEIHFNLAGRYASFISDVGLDDEVGGNGSVGFQVWADGTKLYDSGSVNGTALPQTINVNITGRDELVLIVNNGGDNYYYDHADWAGARLVKAVVTTSQNEAVRLLNQATFGATESSVAHVQDVGPVAFLNEQFSAPSSGYQDFPYYPPTAPVGCIYISGSPNDPSSICNRDNYSLFQLQLRFFQNALTGPDQLRQRVAFALSQIFVVSGAEISQPSAMGPYQQILLQDAFGNFRQLLSDITLNPAMGKYLDMVNNDKPNQTAGTEPNENYARELLQLFSIGTIRLNRDGTPQLDPRGKTIPTYNQDTVEGLAHAFTGWTYPTKPGSALIKHNPQYYVGPMVSYASNHDAFPKQLLDGVTLPGSQTPEKDLNDTLDNVFNHPNVSPFICKQLIQHLVTSNPSPAYVGRVADVFNDNGVGTRGDLKAVVRAILLDAEARGDTVKDADYGHLQEPVLYTIKALRALNGRSDGVYLRSQVSSMGQNLFYSPSVFNYYPPDYVAPGTNILGPEFGIQNAATSLIRTNFINSVVFSNSGIAPDPTVINAIGTSIDLTSLQALAADPAQLLDRLNTLLMHGTMSANMRDSIARAVSVVPATDPRTRARTAVYLVLTSAQYQVER